MRKLSLVILLSVLCLLANNCIADSWWTDTNYVKLDSQIADVSTDSLSVRINGTIKTVSNIYNAAKKKTDSSYNSSPIYACAAYPHKFYSEVFGIEIYNLSGSSYVPKVSSGGGSFSAVSSPRIGDIVRSDISTHWAIVKSVDSYGTVTVIQQNAGYFNDKDNDNYYAMINTKIAKPYSSVTFFRWSGASILTPADAPLDAPTSNVTASDTLHTVNISWNPVSNVDFYSIRLYDASGNRIYLRDDYQKTSFAALLPVAMPAGNYQAEVCAVIRDVWVSESDRIPFTVTAASPTHTPHLYDARVLENKVYKVFDTPVTWLEAKALAEGSGGRLAVINTQAKQNCIHEMVNAYNGLFFIGAHGYYYTWLWSDGSAVEGYTNWNSGKPDNWEGMENVLLMYPNGTWEDVPNDNPYGYVAEFDLTSLSVMPNETPWTGGVAAIRQNLTVRAHFSDGSSYVINDYQHTASENNGVITVNVTYGGKSASCTVASAPVYNLSVYCGGNVSRPYGIFVTAPAGKEINMSSFDFGLTDEENAQYVFGRYDSSVGSEVFADYQNENTIFTMPASDVTITKVYYQKEPLYSNATFCATNGGVLYVYIADTDANYTVYESEPLTLSLYEGQIIAVQAVPADFYFFSGWNTSDFWIQNTTEPGAHQIPMQNHDTRLCAEFSAGPYAFDASQGFILPEYLTVIEEEAFTDVAAKFFFVRENVTRIGRSAFPTNAVVYLDVSNIDLPLDAIAQTGTYIDYGNSPDMEFAASAQGTPYTVLDSHGNPLIRTWGDWSEWSETPAIETSVTQVETKTQYSYRDTTYETKYTDWSAWSGWTTERQATSDLKREESTPLYIWYWYECPSCHHHDPTYGSCRSCGTRTTSSDYNIWLLPVSQYGNGTYADGSRRAYDDPDGTAWYNVGDNNQYSYTGYRYSTRSTYEQPVTGAWSEYSDVAPAEQTNREIRTRVLYRFRNAE